MPSQNDEPNGPRQGERPVRYRDPQRCVDDALSRLGRRVVLGTPLGVGKANHLVNAFYRRAVEDRELDLTLVTALTLTRPTASSELERRLLDPLVERLFGDYPELRYAVDRARGELPPNVTVREFYYPPGSLVGNPSAQQNHISSNYTFVVRDLLDAGVNAVAQLVSPGEVDGEPRLSLSSNPDLTLDLVPRLARRDEPLALLAQVNPNLPFMAGPAAVPPDTFHAVLDDPALHFGLPSTPNGPVSTADYLIGVHASALVRDGGTLQLGIGSLGDAVTRMLQLRHQNNDTWRRVLADCGTERCSGVVDRVGGREPFERGLYAATEMLVDGFLELYRAGILKRRVYPDADLQRLLDDGVVGEEVTPDTLDALVGAGAVAETLGAGDVERLRRLGVLAPEVRWEDGELVLPDGRRASPDLGDAAARRELAAAGLGDRLAGGRLAHAGFFLGPRAFYRSLREMPRQERDAIEMTAISFVNELYGDEEGLKRVQRRHARFLNSGLKATLLGGVASETLADGRVLSGVGGQYNFVSMAHELEDGRSVLMVRAVRDSDGEPESNVVWSYANLTVPRHLRDLVVTEYGVADLRGESDAACIAALLEVADSRFQESLMAEAKRAGKLPPDHRIPERFRNNTPERLERALEPHRERGLFRRYPFGTDLSEEEQVLARALKALDAAASHHRRRLLSPSVLRRVAAPPPAARPYLERMELDRPRGLRERALHRAVVAALALTGAI